MSSTTGRMLVGWREWLMLPEICSVPIKAKIDTGAKTSALHAHAIEIASCNGTDRVSFELHPFVDSDESAERVEFPVIDYRTVSSSNGASELRPVIETDLSIGPQLWRIEVTLTNRVDMGFAMLLGRTAMRHRLTVDPSASFLLEPNRSLNENLTPSPGCTLPGA